MLRLPKRRIFLVGSLVLFGSLAVGIAYAAIESGGVIQGCYDKGGNLKIVQALPCPRGHTPIQWNQQGVQGVKGDTGEKGQTGEKGETGEKGDPGSSGLAPAFTNYGTDLQDIGQGLTRTVASVTLPTGSYTLMASVYVISGGDDTRFGQCFFAPGTPYVNGNLALAYVANNNPARLLILGDATVTSAGLIVYLRCYGLDGTIRANGEIIATQVGSITPSE